MLTTILAIAGFALGVLNFWRDRSKLNVELRWNAITVQDKKGHQARFGQIYITNKGRRPIYVKSAGIEFDFPHASFIEHKEKQGKLKGRKLSEGEPPLSLVIEGYAADVLEENRRYWRYIRAFAVDSNGKRYYSTRMKKCPPWGEGDGRVPWNFIPFAHVVECHIEQHDFEAAFIKGDWVLISAGEVKALKKAVGPSAIKSLREVSLEDGTRIVTYLDRTGRGLPPG